MANENEITEKLPTLRDSDVSAFITEYNTIPGDPIYNALLTIRNYGVKMELGDSAGADSLAYENREALGAMWRRVKESEKAAKQLKPIIEFIAGRVSMTDVFKWQAGAKRTSKDIPAANNAELWKRLETQGVSLDAFLACCKVDFDSAVELSGFNEKKFLEEFAGDLCNVETKQAKAILKGLA